MTGVGSDRPVVERLIVSERLAVSLPRFTLATYLIGPALGSPGIGSPYPLLLIVTLESGLMSLALEVQGGGGPPH